MLIFTHLQIFKLAHFQIINRSLIISNCFPSFLLYLSMQIFENHSLKNYNTFGLEARASHFAIAKNVEDLIAIYADTRFKDLDKMILGGGSNILLCKDFEGLMIHIDFMGLEDFGDGKVKVQAGENWHEFVLWTLEQGFNGIENLSLIPGNVGTAPMQNIGAYGVELKDVFLELEAYHIASDQMKVFTNNDCDFGYRESVFKNIYKGDYIICSVTFQLKSDGVVNTSYGAIKDVLQQNSISHPSPKEVSEAVISIRQSKLPDPKEIGNSGSFFKNPVIPTVQFEALKKQYTEIPSYPVNGELVKVPAGWLIEKAGWKGKRFGDYGVHEKQALVLVNYGQAKGEDIYQLAKDIQSSIMEIFGIQLQTEVNIVA